ncbi:hypothetical protein K469DRAFT_706976 [Zopfia rhizophila CBS 207.26]|uniref:Uncharacterized protein n=1 Tax=Zopfia rhizophila CBS 207.26 TaxID=1314779 RepID=A0A6A6E588_9PEZI|nr:hypothetical protein K469DRAFT_706976 [Zopfia rhizophila CBS 207.26]
MSAIENPKSTPPLGPSPRSSAVPLLSESMPADDANDQSSLLSKGKRKFLGLGKKKVGDKKEVGKNGANNASDNQPTMSPISPPTLAASPPLSTARRPVSPLHSPPADSRASPRSSPRIYPAGVGASPNRRSQYNRSSSPGLHSPASSQIFERNVQESALSGELSPAIPAHIQTEDHIPPVLEASSLAITDDHLNPDEVEIVMHSAHQPASAAVAGSMTDSVYSPSQDDFSALAHQDVDDSASNYGSLDTTDVRRLSFISFADVVQAEHVENNRDAMQFMSLSTTANRSPSPVRSPTSSHGFSASPPTSGATSEKGADVVSSKVARTPGSPTTTHGTHSPPLGGELQIETMRQALRKTGSGDLSGARSQPLSAVSLEDSAADQPPFK